jgi:hypothetical protein
MQALDWNRRHYPGAQTGSSATPGHAMLQQQLLETCQPCGITGSLSQLRQTSAALQPQTLYDTAATHTAAHAPYPKAGSLVAAVKQTLVIGLSKGGGGSGAQGMSHAATAGALSGGTLQQPGSATGGVEAGSQRAFRSVLSAHACHHPNSLQWFATDPKSWTPWVVSVLAYLQLPPIDAGPLMQASWLPTPDHSCASTQQGKPLCKAITMRCTALRCPKPQNPKATLLYKLGICKGETY